MSATLLHKLIDVDDCMLIVIDVQAAFLQKLPTRESERLVNRIGWLVTVKSLYYEWLRTVTAVHHFRERFAEEIALPEGVSL